MTNDRNRIGWDRLGRNVDNGISPADKEQADVEGLPSPTCFTRCADRCLGYAQEEAIALGEDYVGSDHLLIALAREPAGAAARVLNELDTGADLLRTRLTFVRGLGQTHPVGLPLPPSPRFEHILQMAGIEAGRREDQCIGTLHLLLALVKERKGVGVFLLESPGVGLERVGGAMMRAFREGATDSE